MAVNSTSRGARQRVRVWAHQVLDEMSGLDAEDMSGFAQRALQDAGSDQARQTLVELSVGVQAPGVTAALVRAAVQSGSTQLSRAAADLLIDIKDYDSARSVIEECLQSDDSAVRVRAVEAMETFATSEVFDLLLKALSSGDDSVRRAAVNSFGLIVAGKYHPLKSHMLQSLADQDSELYSMVARTEEVGLKREFAQLLGFADSEDVIPLLKELSDDPDSQTRREAVLALAAHGGSRALEITENKLDDDDELVVTFALDSLASKSGRDSEHMLQCIIKAMEHPNEAVRRNAVMMLNWFPPSRIEEVLAGAVKDPDFEVQRSAQSLLRSMRKDLAPMGLEATGAGEWGEETLKIWEVGNVGMESEQMEKKSTVDADWASTDAIVAELEKQAGRGEVSRRGHAITELLELEDISDSPLLRKALYDENESIRMRVARGLDFTRDAGLTTQVLREHPDSLVRRRAVDALAENPSGRTRGRSGRTGLTFASERTQGMELFSYFLMALDDEDEGVIQSACYAIGNYLEFKRPIPVRLTMGKLEALESNADLSSLTRDSAAELVDDINEAELGEPLVNVLEAAADQIGVLKAAAAQLRGGMQEDSYTPAGAGESTEDTARRLREDVGCGSEEANRIAEAVQEDGSLDAEAAGLYADAVSENFCRVFEALSRGAQAFARLGEDHWDEKLKGWQEELERSSTPAFGEGPAFEGQARRAERWRKKAIVDLRAARAILGNELAVEQFEEFSGSDDDWVRMAALAAAGIPGTDGDEEKLRSLIEHHKDDPGFDEVLGQAALCMAGRGEQAGADVLADVVGRCSPGLRSPLTHALVACAQDAGVQKLIKSSLQKGDRRPPLSSLCLKIALLSGVGGEAVDEGPEPDPGEAECVIAYKGLKAMENDADSAEWLKDILRGGDRSERELAARYLGLSRVESATAVFAGVSDQVDADWNLRALCAGLMVRKGHRQGIGWFNKNAGHGSPRSRALTALHLAEAMVDILPLMRRCNEVNVGRFV